MHSSWSPSSDLSTVPGRRVPSVVVVEGVFDLDDGAEKVGLSRDFAPFNRFVHSCGVLPSSGALRASASSGGSATAPENLPLDGHAAAIVDSEGSLASSGLIYSRSDPARSLTHKGKRGLPLYSAHPQTDRRIRDVEKAVAEGGGSARSMRTP